jgi:hypothetical protein
MATTVLATPGERPGDRTKAISSKRSWSCAALAAAGAILAGLVSAEAKIKTPPQIHNAQWFQHQKCLNDPSLCPSNQSGRGNLRPPRRPCYKQVGWNTVPC